jgi:amino acid permease
MPIFGAPGPLPRWFWVTVWAVVVGLIVLMALGVTGSVLEVVFIVGIVAFLLFIAREAVRQSGGSDALGKPKRPDR